jgi:hypothetical protein
MDLQNPICTMMPTVHAQMLGQLRLACGMGRIGGLVITEKELMRKGEVGALCYNQGRKQTNGRVKKTGSCVVYAGSGTQRYQNPSPPSTMSEAS